MANAMQVVMLALALLAADPNQPRQNYHQEDIALLAIDIRRRGILMPLLVRKGDDGKFIIVDGHRRFYAAIEAGLSEVPCIIVTDASNGSVLETQMATFLHRSDLSMPERGKAYAELMERKKWSIAMLCLQTGADKTDVSRCLKVHKNVTPEILRLSEQGKIAGSVVFELCKALEEGRTEEELNEIVKQAGDGRLTAKDVQRLLKKKKPGKSEKQEKVEVKRDTDSIKSMVVYPKVYDIKAVIAELNQFIADVKRQAEGK